MHSISGLLQSAPWRGLDAILASAPGASPAGTGKSTAATLLDYIRDGGLLSYVLIGLSVVALALIIRNLYILRLSQFAPRRVIASLEPLLAANRVDEIERFTWAPKNRCFVTVVLAEAFNRCRAGQFGLFEFRSVVEEVAKEDADEVHRVNDGIGIIAAVGPMLGLLGTVIGMIGAFRTIGTLEGAARSNELAVFMSMALVNTAEGLIVAIPCTIAFALFRRRIDRIMHVLGRDLERFAGQIAGTDTRPGGRIEAAAGQRGPSSTHRTP